MDHGMDYHRRPISTTLSDDETTKNNNQRSAIINVRLERNMTDDEQSSGKPEGGEDLSEKRLAAAPPSTVFLKTRNETLQPKKFSSRCRLFIGNVATKSEEEFKKMFEPFGEVSEVYLNPQGEYGLVKMDTKANACLAKASLDCSLISGKHMIVRFAAQCASLRVSNLHPLCSNELLKYSFAFFGEVERAVVIMDDQGKSTGQGIVGYTSKTAAKRALKKCTEGCFVITGSPQPVLVEPYHENDEEVGLQEKTIPKRSNLNYFKERNAKPRFTEPGTWEHDIALEWKKLYNMAKKKRDDLEMEIQNKRKMLEEKMTMARVEEKTLKDRLKHLDEEREMLRRQLEIREKEKDTSDDAAQPEEFDNQSNQFSDYGTGIETGSGYSNNYDHPMAGASSDYVGSSDHQSYIGEFDHGSKNIHRGRGVPIKRSPMEWRRGPTTSFKRGRFQN